MAIQKKAAPPAKTAATSAKKPQKPGPHHDDAGHDEGGGEGGDGGRMSKADAFDNAKASGAVDNGKYEAIIVELVLQPEDEKGQSVRCKYEIASEGDFRGESVAQWYKIFEANGDVAKGMAFLKKDLAVLGKADVRFGDLEEVFEEIVDSHVGVLVTVKQNGAFTNIYLNGLCEDSAIIDDYLATRSFD